MKLPLKEAIAIVMLQQAPKPTRHQLLYCVKVQDSKPCAHRILLKEAYVRFRLHEIADLDRCILYTDLVVDDLPVQNSNVGELSNVETGSLLDELYLGGVSVRVGERNDHEAESACTLSQP